MGNTKKAVISIILIILATFAIVLQVKHNTKGDAQQTAEQAAAQLEKMSGAQSIFNSAVEQASKSGWSTTGKYWKTGALNGMVKKNLDTVFGKSFNVGDVTNQNFNRDSENNQDCVVFQFQGKSYIMHFVKDKKGNYLLTDFALY
ncbi:MAG: hypothetical protein MJ202_08335 [Lentisphaeria bacterium]|nr:hypothetical protein [Lentisphaeria bacterium]